MVQAQNKFGLKAGNSAHVTKILIGTFKKF